MDPSRPTLGLPHGSDAPRVKEAKELVATALGRTDHTVVPWAMRLTEDRDVWLNSRKQRHS
jgi:hypothetical protein